MKLKKVDYKAKNERNQNEIVTMSLIEEEI